MYPDIVTDLTRLPCYASAEWLRCSAFKTKMKIEIVPYCPEWRVAFEEEKRSLLGLEISAIEEIHHIGSTAVKSLAAKPIIDIMLEVNSLDVLDREGQKFEALGYEPMGEFGIEGRRYFRKGGENRTHQIHAFLSNDVNLMRHLAFRDYLRKHSDIRDEYGELKVRVARHCDHDIDRYCEGKDEFIKFHEMRALEWMNLESGVVKEGEE